MKTTIFMFIITSMICLSCNKSTILTNSINVDELIVNDTILSFESENQMRTQIQELLCMSSDARDLWYKENNNFLSQNEFKWIVAEEISKISKLEEAIKIQEKYKDMFKFNYSKENPDLAPYVIHDDFSLSLVCNKNGNVLIGGELINFNISTKSSDITVLKEVYVETSNRKFWAKFIKYTGQNQVYLFLSSQKRILGIAWNIYKGKYCFDMGQKSEMNSWLELSDFAVVAYNESGEDNYVQINGPYKTGSISADSEIYWGLSNVYSDSRFYIWSEDIGESNKKFLSVK